MLIGYWAAGKITDLYLLVNGDHSWNDIWLFPAIFAFGVLIIFVVFFRNEKIEYNE